ncbi:MAG: hypothetical protein L6R45_03295 [Anaerolineae bacterium]|nr:hypothetical protein [Anaerolineae bacterium]
MARRPLHLWYLNLILPFILLLGVWCLISEGKLYQSAYYGKWYDASPLWLTSDSEVRQEFVANYPGLYRVDVFVKNLNPAIPIELMFQLRHSCQNQKDLRRQTMFQPQGEIEGQTFYAFTFAPLEDSTHQKYCFILTAHTESHEKVVGVLAAEDDLYPFGQAFHQEPLIEKNSDKPDVLSTPQSYSEDKFRLFLPIVQANIPDNHKNLDVAFQLHYDGSRLETSKVFFDRLVKHKPYGWNRPEFYGLLFIAYIAGVTALIRLTIKQM